MMKKLGDKAADLARRGLPESKRPALSSGATAWSAVIVTIVMTVGVVLMPTRATAVELPGQRGATVWQYAASWMPLMNSPLRPIVEIAQRRNLAEWADQNPDVVVAPASDDDSPAPVQWPPVVPGLPQVQPAEDPTTGTDSTGTDSSDTGASDTGSTGTTDANADPAGDTPAAETPEQSADPGDKKDQSDKGDQGDKSDEGDKDEKGEKPQADPKSTGLPEGYSYVLGRPTVNGCKPIAYTIDAASAPAGGAEIAQAALDQAANLTGLTFVPADQATDPGQQITITFRSESADSNLAGAAVGFTQGIYPNDANKPSQQTISLESEWFSTNITAYATTAQLIILHEIGHALGLEHVGDTNSIMASTLTVHALTPADEQAFAALNQGC